MDRRARGESVISGGRLIKFLAKKRAWFESWRATNEFAQQIEEIDRIIDSPFLFNRTGINWYWEALSLASYAKIEKVPRVRLNRHDPPDAYVFKQGTTIPVEITEVLEPGRERGLEYRWGDNDTGIRWDTLDKRGFGSEDLVKRAGEIAAALEERIVNKASKTYPPNTLLLIDLNMSILGFRRDEVREKICSVLASDFGFSEIVVLWNGMIFKRSTNGGIKWRCARTSTPR
jgi:hypothetical protein